MNPDQEEQLEFDFMDDDSVLGGPPESEGEEDSKIKSIFLDQLHQLCDHHAKTHLNLRNGTLDERQNGN